MTQYLKYRELAELDDKTLGEFYLMLADERNAGYWLESDIIINVVVDRGSFDSVEQWHTFVGRLGESA